MKTILQFDKHYYEREYKLTGLYCPLCGQKSVWNEQSPGDYYEGSTYLCINCGSSHTLDRSKPVDDYYKGTIDQLKSGITAEPKGRKGN